MFNENLDNDNYYDNKFNFPEEVNNAFSHTTTYKLHTSSQNYLLSDKTQLPLLTNCIFLRNKRNRNRRP